MDDSQHLYAIRAPEQPFKLKDFARGKICIIDMNQQCSDNRSTEVQNTQIKVIIIRRLLCLNLSVF